MAKPGAAESVVKADRVKADSSAKAV